MLTLDRNLEKTQSLSEFNSLFKNKAFPATYSLFVPEDSAFKVFHPVELSYLKTRFGAEDRTNLISRHATKGVLYVNDLEENGTCPSIEGEIIRFRSKNGSLLVNNANITRRDVVARNGLLSILLGTYCRCNSCNFQDPGSKQSRFYAFKISIRIAYRHFRPNRSSFGFQVSRK